MSSPKISPHALNGLFEVTIIDGAFVAAGDEHEHQARGFGVERDVADLVDLCGYPHRSTCADIATMPTSSPRPV